LSPTRYLIFLSFSFHLFHKLVQNYLLNKLFYIFHFVILFCSEAKTQTEYITNGSFEQIDSCYGNAAPIGFDVFSWAGCKGWSNPIASSSDLWCENPLQGVVTPPYIPSCGYQYPHSGNNMAGLLIGAGAGYANYREYIQNTLHQKLTLSQNYVIEFYLSKGTMPCTTNKFGIKFFNAMFNDLSTYWLTNLTTDADNEINNFITDTLGWQKVTMQYKANGNEKYVIIGSFADSLNLSLEPNGCDTTGNGSSYVFGVGYFFIDDVSIKEIEPLAPVIPNVFTPNSDLVNDVWRCDFSAFETVNCSIYNRWGNLIFQSNKQIILWDGRTTSGIRSEDGIYFYCIETETEKYKGHIQLIK
jgi:gliding motility-associated-like protein